MERVAAISSLALLFLAARLIGAGVAEPGCGGVVQKDAVGGYEGTTSRYGNRASVFVNNFDRTQYNSWRMVWVLKSINNNAEAGWV